MLETTYYSLIKCCLGVRKNTPNKLVLIESGMPLLQSLIYCRQYNFFTNFLSNLTMDSPRKIVLDTIQQTRNDYLIHYVTLLSTFQSKKHIQDNYNEKLVSEINYLAENNNYKFQLYKLFNPNLKPLNLSKIHTSPFIRLRLSSHFMPVETGRWSRVNRELRLCETCNILGDEMHFIYHCTNIDRSQLRNIPELHELEKYEQLELLLSKLEKYL